MTGRNKYSVFRDEGLEQQLFSFRRQQREVGRLRRAQWQRGVLQVLPADLPARMGISGFGTGISTKGHMDPCSGILGLMRY